LNIFVHVLVVGINASDIVADEGSCISLAVSR